MLSSNARLMKEHQDQMIQQTKSVHSLVGKMEDSSSFKEALQQQKTAIKATTDMHEVLAQVAREMMAQGRQLKKQTAAQAKMVKESAEFIEKSGVANEAKSPRPQKPPTRKAPKVAPQNKTSAKISTAEAKALKAFAKLNQSGSDLTGKVAVKEVVAPQAVTPVKRRRDPNKPVMFMRSEEVTAMRNKTAAPVVAEPVVAAPEVAAPVVSDSAQLREPQNVLKMPSGRKGKPRRRSRPAPMIIKPRQSPFLAREEKPKTVESAKPKARISIDALKQLLKNNASKKTDSVVMPDAKTMQDRARFRENQRISDDARNKSASRPKRAA